MADDTQARKDAATVLELEQKARSAQISADNQEFDLQLKREKARQPESAVEYLKALKEALPSVTPGLPATLTTISDKTLIAAPFVYAALHGAVEGLVKAINASEFGLESKDEARKDYRLTFIDQSIANDVAIYHALINRAKTLLKFYPKKTPLKPNLKELVPGAAVVGVLSAIAAGVGLAQKIYDAFKVTTTLNSSNVEIDAILFENMVKARLKNEIKEEPVSFGADQIETIDWTLNEIGKLSIVEGIVQGLIEVSQGYTGDELKALKGEIASLTKEFIEFGSLKAHIVEQLAASLRSDTQLLLYVNLIHASALVALQDESFKPESVVKVHPSIVTGYTIMTSKGVIIASDVNVHKPVGIRVDL